MLQSVCETFFRELVSCKCMLTGARCFYDKGQELKQKGHINPYI